MACGLVATACQVKETDSAGVTAEVQQNSIGVIDIYRGKAGRRGIDACLTLALAAEMRALLPHEGASGLHFYQAEVGGMVAIDVEVPPAVAARAVAMAKSAGALIRA
jgi:hypothetical protein